MVTSSIYLICIDLNEKMKQMIKTDASRLIKSLSKMLLSIIILYLPMLIIILNIFPGAGHWGNICSKDKVENGIIKIQSTIAFLNKEKCPEGFNQIEVWVKNNPVTNQIVKARNKKSTITGQYLVSVANPPVLRNGGFSFTTTVKNISVKPFLTKLSLSNCVFTDNNQNTYKKSGDDKTLDKALLIGKTTNIDFDSVGDMWHECHYDNSGNQVCISAKDTRLTSCQVSISNGSGEPINLSQTVNFPQSR